MKDITRKILTQGTLFLLLITALIIKAVGVKGRIDDIILSLLILNLLYLFFKIILEGIVHKRLRDYKVRYTFRKTTSIFFLALSGIGLIAIWIQETQAVLVAYGLIAAGIAIALQDLFKGFTGGLLILANNLYRVGDRVQIGETYGDVMDIGILYTTLMETRGWVQGDQATGRIISMPNSMVLSNSVKNYTKDHNFLWEEISIPLTFDSNWEALIAPVLRKTYEYCREMTTEATKEIDLIGEKYYLPRRDVEPAVYVSFDDRFITLRVRFITEARKRRFHSDNVHRMVLKEASKHKDVKIAQAQIESWKLGEGP